MILTGGVLADGNRPLAFVDALNHQSIESLEGMIDRLKDLYEEHKHDEIKAALKYLIQAQIDFPNA